MLSFSIGEKEYHCPDTWQDMTISTAVELKTMADQLPQTIKDYFLQNIKPSMGKAELSDEDTEVLNKFWQDILIMVSDVPAEIVEQVVLEDIVEICNGCFLIYVLSLLFTPLYEPSNIECFEWKGETLRLPQSGTDILGVKTPLEKIKSKEFCDASDISMVNDLALAPLFVAILCRPEGEEYDEERVKQRAKTMQELPMNYYLEVFFCLVQLTITLQESTLTAMKKEIRKEKRRKKD